MNLTGASAFDVALKGGGKVDRRGNRPGCRINGVPGVRLAFHFSFRSI
jgi:hypothetical protein